MCTCLSRHFTLIAVLLLVGCDKPEPPAPTPPPVVEAETASVEQELHPVLQQRQAYGLPIPPDVTYIQDVASIDVGTPMTVAELRGFFTQRLVDHELVELSKTDIRFVSLHSAGVDVRVFRRSPRGATIVRYTPRREYFENEADRTPAAPLKPGDKVETRLSDGRLLAPGAVYGEPYTPEPGDPLYKESYRANFGKPFGSWILN